MKPSLQRLGALLALVASSAQLAHAAGTYEYRAPKKGLAVSGSSSAPTPAPAPAPAPTYLAQTSSGAVEFDPTPVGSQQMKTVAFSNVGTGTLALSEPLVSGSGFSATTSCGATLAPGASCYTDVTFTPTRTGTASGSVSFASNAQGSPSVVTLTGVGTQVIGTLLPVSTSNFGTLTVGAGASRQFQFLNSGNVPTSAYATVSPGSDLTITANSCGTQASPGSVMPGDSCVVTVSWTPSTAGSLSGTLTVHSEAPDSPATLSLSGTAVAPVDASFASVGVLLGADALPLTDSSSNNFLVSNTNVTLTTGRFGSGAMNFDGGSTLLTLPGSMQWSQAGAYTLEAWVNLPNNGGGGWLWSRVTPNYLNLIVNANGSVDIDKSSVGIQRSFAAGTVPTNTWAHIAMTSDGSTVRFFVNGSLKGSFAAGNKSDGGGGSIVIGRYANGNGWFKGSVDELRWTAGVARYTADFTPPSAAFPRQ